MASGAGSKAKGVRVMSSHLTTEQCPLDPTKIPHILTKIPRWQIWKIGESKEDGKFGKIPIDRNGYNCNANDPSNWLTYDEAVALYKSGKCAGIGIALSDTPIDIDGTAFHLVAIDLDNCSDFKETGNLRRELGGVYAEISPSMRGARMFCLSRIPIKGGNYGGGHELYSSGRFMTVTGVGGRGQVIDTTAGLINLQSRWFLAKSSRQPLTASLPPELVGAKSNRQLNKLTLSLMGASHRPETPGHIAHVKDQLKHVSADCTYDEWRSVVWAVLSTGWECAVSIVREWSETAPERFKEDSFKNVVESFDPLGGITLGTLDYMARQGGWLPTQAPLTSQTGGTGTVVTAGAASSRFDLLTYQDLRNEPPMRWRIKGVLPERGLAAIYGASGSGKSFLGIHMAGSIACGMPKFFGSVARQAPVVYVVLEGAAGISKRIEAWSTHNGQVVPDALRIVAGNFTLTGVTDAVVLANEVVRVVGRGAVVIIDTLNQSAPGSDENSSVDMGNVLKNAKALSDEIEGLVVLVHHAGKDANKGMRGHSSLWAAMDAVIEVVRDKDGRRWRNAKQKDAADGDAFGFELVPYTLGKDADGDDIRSCAVRPMLSPAAVGAKAPSKAPSGRNQVAALLAVERAAANGKPIPRSDAIRAGGLVLNCDPKHRASRATSAIDSLVRSGHLLETEGGLIPA